MELNIKGTKEEQRDIQVGDLVVDGLFGGDESVLLVIEGVEGDTYNVIVFDTKSPQEDSSIKHDIYVNHTKDISYNKLQSLYKLLRKSEDVKITIEF